VSAGVWFNFSGQPADEPADRGIGASATVPVNNLLCRLAMAKMAGRQPFSRRFGAARPQPAEQLLTLVYEELRRLAMALLATEKPGQTLQPTALVHEAYLRLAGTVCRQGGASRTDNSRSHFLPPRPKPCDESWSIKPSASRP
jgi:hypothetical protein